MVKNSKRLIILFTLICILTTSIITTNATALDPNGNEYVPYLCELIISVKTPENFKDRVVFYIQDKYSGKKLEKLLWPDNNYSGQWTIWGGTEYLVTVYFKSQDIYEIKNVEESYILTSGDFVINSTIEPNLYDVEENKGIVNENDTSTDERESGNISEINSNSTGSEVLANFRSKVAFMENDSDFDWLLGFYSGEAFKKYYLEADSLNTVEMWNEMSRLDRFIYYITYVYPKVLFMSNYTLTDEPNLLKNLKSTGELLRHYSENGDAVYNAIEEVWKWHWKQWEEKGIFVNIYDEDVQKEVDKKEDIIFTEDEKQELKKDVNDSTEEKTTKTTKANKTSEITNPVLQVLYNNKVTLIILVIVAIAFLIVRNKNIKRDIEDDEE